MGNAKRTADALIDAAGKTNAIAGALDKIARVADDKLKAQEARHNAQEARDNAQRAREKHAAMVEALEKRINLNKSLGRDNKAAELMDELEKLLAEVP